MDWSNRYIRVSLSVLVTLICIYLIGQLREFFHDIWLVIKVLVVPFLAAAVVASILDPIVDVLARRKVPRGIAILIIYLAFILLALIAILNAIPIVSRQLQQLLAHLPSLVTQADQWIDTLAQKKQYLPDAVRVGLEAGVANVEKGVAQFAASVLGMLSGTIGVLFMVVTVPFIVFYLLKDGRSMGRAVVRLWPARLRPKMERIVGAVEDTFGKYVRGQLLVMLAVGILTYAGYLIIGMPYAFVLALFLAAADLIPFFGPLIGAAPALILAFATTPSLAIKVLIVNIIVQQCEGNLISPQIMGRTLQLHPLAIVAALLVGGELGGVLGLVVAVPVLAIARVIWLEFHVKEV